MCAKPSNIVLIMADQLAPQFTGTYGHDLVKTPNLDRLASRGVRFDAAYCNSPLCAPSRYCFMSGQLPSKISAYDNACEFPSAIPTFAHYLRLMGYRTCLAGRMHFVGPDQFHGFEERVTTDVYPSDFGWTPDWDHPDDRIDNWYHNMDSVYEAGCAASTFQIEYDEEVAFNARRKLVEFAREPDQPFCLVASFVNPHDPYVAKPEWWDLYKDENIDLPKTKLSPDQQDAFSKRVMDGIEASKYKPTDDVILNARRGYYANVSYFDSQIGLIERTLAETGLIENTTIIVTADHGEMLGERGLWYKMSFMENSMRVPLVMAGPGMSHRCVSSICSLVDILPTMLDIAAGSGLPRPELAQPVDGRSLLPLTKGVLEDGGIALGEYCAEMTPDPIFMIRRGQFKFIHADCDPPQLYDIEMDPLEHANLANNPNFAELAREFGDQVETQWDSKEIKEKVLASQRTRHFLFSALGGGEVTPWDHNPPRDASQEYVRTHMDWNVATQKTRVPPLDTSE